MMLTTTIWLLRVCNWLNWILAALFAALGSMLLIDPNQFRERFIAVFSNTGGEAIFIYLALACAAVLPVAFAIHLILTRLIALVRDTQAGAAFSERNAKRLATVAWALLAINLLDLAFGQVSIWASEVSGEYFGWSPSVAGWLAVPLLLVLAKVFREGAAMREDLEGTV